ncbi:MAG: hypothetical protein HN926_05340 [Chloroflexi bacterium]|nr:hypothetical protein [Chloroflexota bacterium]MBT3863675.1 hypothetical protein [Chloroflexota bacterium]MBT4143215.1 hypothetical protein [Chloroflexota bacterium]MBT4340558.1 hypothetical protein [Chloroflexota bacterium]MBT4942551.1 hypothetical protein [Chloroflexota bacterium]
MKIVIALAVVIGLVVGIGFAIVASNPDDSGGQKSTVTSSNEQSDPKRDLPIEVLKSLPDEELAEIFPEKAEVILNPDSASQINNTGKTSDNPEYLRALLIKMGANPPTDATTKQLQDMLAQTSTQLNTTSK